MSVSKNRFQVIVCVGLMIALGACKKAPLQEPMVQKISEDSVKLSEEAIKNLKLTKVVQGDFPEKISLMGRISVPEDRTVVVQARVSGRTESIYVASGEVVTAGQPLTSIFSADFAIAREEYVQAVNDLKATPDDDQLKRLLALSKRKLGALGVSPADYEKWVTSVSDSSKGDNIVVRAPRSGALIGKNAVIGNIVNVGDTLFMIGDLSKVWFAGDIYPEDLPKIHKDQEVVIDAGNGTPALKGKISFISPVVDPTSRTIKIRALMDNPGNQLRADMYVQGNIIISTRTALIAPKSSLVRLEDTVFCFKRLPGNVFKKVSITSNGETSDQIAVSKGLDAGDEVVSEGGLLLESALNGEGS